MTLRVAIADDEPLVRERLRSLLARRQDVCLIAECADGASMVSTIRTLHPDLVLLDVQMPELDGFDVVAALESHEMPAVVFVTAYDEYAVRAFEVNAVDYLMKPIEPQRLHAALDRAIERRNAPQPDLTELLTAIRERQRYADRIVARDGTRITFVRVADIDQVEAAGNYVRLHTGRTSVLIREPLKSVEARLDPRRFIRLHRSVIVNIDRIAHVEPHFHGEYVVTLHDGSRLVSSRSYSGRLRALLG